MKLVLVGATGLVGQEMIKVIEEICLPVDEFIPVASKRSVGKSVEYNQRQYQVINISQALEKNPDIVLYSAGSEISLQTAKLFAELGAFVVDNSSAWRMYDDVPLVVPEVNVSTITEHTKIIANPNCSTIQLVVALNPLHKRYKLRKIVISTYQSVTGTGAAAVKQLFDERSGQKAEMVYPHQIDLNCFPHGGSFLDNGYTTEEMKLVYETRKILNDNNLEIESTVVRIPVLGGHSESVYLEFEKSLTEKEVREILQTAPGIQVEDDPQNNRYPTPLSVQGKNETFVGRIRLGLYQSNILQMWIAADNLRKGAATNAVQIANYIHSTFLRK